MGEIEVQYSEGSELNLHGEFKNCSKNPNHLNFIPIDQFRLEHLPERYRNDDIFKFINLTAQLTVRVVCTYVSKKRPPTWPGTSLKYLFSDMRGEEMNSTGTGRVWVVTLAEEGGGNEESDDELYQDGKEYHEGPDYDAEQEAAHVAREEMEQINTCVCENCKDSDSLSSEFGWVKVITARHVVFNNKEARSASCRLFFDSDRGGNPKTILTVVKMATLNPKLDWCWLKCVTCDKGLLERLSEMCKRRHELYLKINGDFEKFRDVAKNNPEIRVSRNLNVIVSHPHGCSKQVSVGEWTLATQYKDNLDDVWTRYFYTTATCKGSSGATTIMLGYTGTDDHVHSGFYTKLKLNHSGLGDDYWEPKVQEKIFVGV
ncbi:hypothetical protein BgiMline_036319 [Biomphalaria glabrata]|uniref:Uncharacterized protein LOC129923892 n=1 Tax=Biomphalaria glabrata TaxID=6526 RepID=A0A9W2ZCT2_BIOGL|nr:uncharacterized protein LOC129923892 [Biomphalaria glabrata]XP_055872773.1 uncharacterized protein LOC129923892 [Biomphalaria glabrata]KAI8752128.1 hypothetical protein BgiMline_014846 [Biomphalaria glabrata]